MSMARQMAGPGFAGPSKATGLTVYLEWPCRLSRGRTSANRFWAWLVP